MNRKSILASTALALTVGLSAVAPAVASADPVITGPTEQAIALGTAGYITGDGCVAPDGAPTYGGVYLRIPSVPGWDDWKGGMIVPADESGTFQWWGETASFPATDIEFTFFCSTDPVQAGGLDAQDPSFLWVSAPYTRTFYGPQADARSLKVSGSTSGQVSVSAATGAKGDEQAFKVDPESLPAADRLGITGRPAAALKGKVDANADAVANVENFFRAFLGRTATQKELDLYLKLFGGGRSNASFAKRLASSSQFRFRGSRTVATKSAQTRATSGSMATNYADENYVIAAFHTLGGRVPTRTELATYSDQLDQGLPKVQVIEDIALRFHDAAWWNVKALKK
jgi:hypothetical protein